MLDDKIKSFINGYCAIVIEKNGGYAFNKIYSSPLINQLNFHIEKIFYL